MRDAVLFKLPPVNIAALSLVPYAWHYRIEAIWIQKPN